MRTTFTRPALALAFLVGLVTPPALRAQLTFAPPAPANVARYLHVEECLAASARVRDSVESWGGLWMDTLVVEERRKPQASFAPAREAARRCAGNIQRGDEGLTNFAPWFELHLSANSDDRAQALLERRLAAIAPGAIAERAAVLDSAVAIALLSSPARLALAERVLDLRDQHDSILSPTQLYSQPWNLMLRAQIMGDHEAAVRAARRMVGLHTRAKPVARDRAAGRQRDQMLFMAHTVISMDSALAALRTQGTDAYVAIRRDSWAKATGGLAEGIEIPIGEPAPEIQADVWVGDRKGDGPRPTKGRISLVAFVPTACKDVCARAVASMRRIVERFPELEVTLLTSTTGHVNPVLTPTVAEEAAMLHGTLLASYRVPGALAVEDARPWYLPAPDGRRIEMPTPNREAYGFGAVKMLTQPFSTFVVDREGTIVEHQVFGNALTNALTEELVSTTIAILLARQGGTAGGAR